MNEDSDLLISVITTKKIFTIQPKRVRRSQVQRSNKRTWYAKFLILVLKKKTRIAVIHNTKQLV